MQRSGVHPHIGPSPWIYACGIIPHSRAKSLHDSRHDRFNFVDNSRHPDGNGNRKGARVRHAGTNHRDADQSVESDLGQTDPGDFGAGMLDVVIIIVFGTLWFNVPHKGDRFFLFFCGGKTISSLVTRDRAFCLNHRAFATAGVMDDAIFYLDPFYLFKRVYCSRLKRCQR